MKNKIYFVVGNGANKSTGELYSKAYAVKETRENGYQYLDMKDVIYLDEIKPVGHRFEVILTIK